MKDFSDRTPAAKTAMPAPGKGPALVDNRATAVAQRKMQEFIANSPRQVAQRQQAPVQPATPRPNHTGLSDQLKAGVESLSGYSLDDVKVHYNSAKPAELQAHAYAQGTDIHLGPGQEQHLPHEAWHVVQQKQGRVRPTMQLKGKVAVNNDAGLEKEADVMGKTASRFANNLTKISRPKTQQTDGISSEISQLQTIQMVSYVKRVNGEIDEVADDYREQEGEVLLDRHAHQEYIRHQAELARFRQLQNAKEAGPIMTQPPNPGQTSATLSHLNTPYVSKYMYPQGPLTNGVVERFLTPTPNAIGNADGLKKRQISQQQVEKYKEIGNAAIETEEQISDTHYAFYHAQDPRMRIAQDVYRRVYSRHHKKELPEDFHFLRFPVPGSDEFSKHKDVQSYFKDDMGAHGMIDDNINPTKTHLTSVNPALHGGLGHAGEETFHYFQIGQGQTELPVANIMGGFLNEFGLDSSGTKELYEKAAKLNETKEGSLFQIMVPKKIVDDVAYMAHPHGLPHDDELFDDLHEMGEIRYPRREETMKDPEGSDTEIKKMLPSREKMNDELTRNLLNMRTAHLAPKASFPNPTEPVVMPNRETQSWEEVESANEALETRKQQARTFLLQKETERLSARTLKRFEDGVYRPSQHLEDYIHDPAKLQHPEGHAQRLRMKTNPEHFGGQGVHSPHELMRIQNRSTFMQARLHFSEANTLNPDSDIRIKRYTTMGKEQEEAYNRMLDEYVEGLYAKKNNPIKTE